jgi:hypothetical protein
MIFLIHFVNHSHFVPVHGIHRIITVGITVTKVTLRRPVLGIAHSLHVFSLSTSQYPELRVTMEGALLIRYIIITDFVMCPTLTRSP